MTNLFSSDLTNFIKIYTDFAFFLLISPVRFSRFPNTGHFYLKSWWPQKVLSFLFSFLSLFWLLSMIRQSVPRENEKNPATYFALVLNIIGLSVKMTTLKKFWLNKYELKNILNFINRDSHELPLTKPILDKASRKIVVYALCTVYAAVGISNFATGRGLGHISDWSLKWWWSGAIRTACYNFHLSNSTCVAITTSHWSGVAGILSAIGFYQRHILGLYCELFLLSGVLTLWTCTCSFASLLEQDIKSQLSLSDDDNNDNYDDIFVFTKKWFKTSNISLGYDQWLLRHRQYLALQRLVTLINAFFGTNMTLFLADAILYYSTSFHEVFIQDSKNYDGSKVFRLAFFFLNTCVILVFSADVNHQMNIMKEWLTLGRIKGNIPIDQLHIYLNDLEMRVVAVKGSNIFSLTFGVIAQIVALTVTYFVICIQT